MDRDALRMMVQNILRDVVDDNRVTITDESVAYDVPGWDSTNHVRLIVAIEEELNIRFETNEITEPETVGELLDVIQSKLAH